MPPECHDNIAPETLGESISNLNRALSRLADLSDARPEFQRQLAPVIARNSRHIRITFFSAAMHGGFRMSNRLYAACYAAQRISIALAQAESSVASDPELAGAIVQCQAACGRLIQAFEAEADRLDAAA